jgi:hypothetical protein
MIARAIALLYRWLEHDAQPERVDLSLDDETNDLLLAYPVPRAELDQAVLDACARLVLAVHEDGDVTCTIGQHDVERAEWARRKAKAEANEIRRGLTAAAPEVRARARDALRRLESGR